MENKAKRSRGASFFKVLDGDFSKQLQMPLAFTTNFNGEIPHWLFIEIAGTRKCWRVDVEHNDNGGLNFTNGWDNFVKAHALEVGNAMVFEYKGQLMLQVTVYEKDGFEKLAGQTSEFKEEYKAEDSEHQSQTLKTERHHAEEVARSSRRTREHCDVHEKQQEKVRRKKRRRCEVSITEKGVRFSLTCGDRNTLYYYQTIPKPIVTEKKLSGKERVVIKDQEGNRWPIELRTRLDGRVDMTEGWREFMNSNKIAVGDILSFKFLSDVKILVRVVRASQVNHPSQSVEHCRASQVNHPSQSVEHCRKEADESLNVASDPDEASANSTDKHKTPESSESTENVCSEFRSSPFSTTWNQNWKSSYLYIPKQVAREQKMWTGKKVILCDEEEKQWELRVSIKPDGRTLLRGWSEFWRTKKFAHGDTLNFEFVTEVLMKLNIDKASQVNHAVEWVPVKQELLEID